MVRPTRDCAALQVITLRPYQEAAAAWLPTLRNALLLDAPRVGKTYPLLAASERAGAKRIAVLGPAIAREVWRRAHADMACTSELIVESYDKMVVGHDHAERFRSFKPDVLILDECHRLRNGTAKRTKRVYGRDFDMREGVASAAGAVWGASGSLAPNNLGETWTHLHAMGRTDRSFPSFLHRYCHVSQTPWGIRVGNPRPERVEEFKQLLAPISMRRRYKDVWPDLPPIAWNTIPLEMTAGHRADLLRAQQEVQLDRVLERLPSATPDQAQAMLGSVEIGTSSLRRLVSEIKTPMVIEQVREMLDGGLDKLVVCGWHTAALDQMHAAFAPYGSELIYGATSERQRWAKMDRFQTDPSCRILVGQIQTMGESITLNAARHLLFAEYDWNLGLVLQAAVRILDPARAEPMEIMVCSLAGTIDDAIADVMVRKGRHHDILNNLEA